MGNIYFISDVHLSFGSGDAETEKRKKLFDFFDYLAGEGNAAELYILGDLFDFWFEWHHVVPKYWFPVLYRFRKLSEAGVNVNFVTGNHDFYTGRYLEEEVGIRCFNESHQFEVGGRRFFVGHGDGLAKEDRGYRLLKRIIRNRVSIFLFKTFISADLGMQIARWTSRSSRKMVKIEKHSWSEEYYRYACGKFQEGYDYVVLGHIHLPILREDDTGQKAYVNCGDWMNQFSYGLYDGTRLMLKYWKNSDSETGK
jgi:UDP-2,3-diacylglucosamine hydrolase